MSNRYQALARLVATVSNEVFGMHTAEAVEHIDNEGLRSRMVRIEGDARA